ncbi:MAG TPA: hypothetical protein VFB09_08705, partial [Actinomycetota bacterium]|nr:hypothetical protein [Actinomycetota bacterium]
NICSRSLGFPFAPSNDRPAGRRRRRRMLLDGETVIAAVPEGPNGPGIAQRDAMTSSGMSKLA